MSEEFLLGIDGWLWLVDSIIFLSIIYLSTKESLVYSSTITFGIAFIYGGISHRLVEVLLKYKDGDYRPFVLMAWYLGFALMLSFAIKLTRTLHIKFRVDLQPLARLYLIAYVVIANILLVTYADELTFKTGWIDGLYMMGIPLINAGLTVVSAIIMLIAYWHYFRKTKTRYHLCQI